MFESAPAGGGGLQRTPFTAPKIDPGFRGSITLEMFNLGPFPLKLSYAMAIGSLMLDRLGQPADAGYAGRFQG